MFRRYLSHCGLSLRKEFNIIVPEKAIDVILMTGEVTLDNSSFIMPRVLLFCSPGGKMNCILKPETGKRRGQRGRDGSRKRWRRRTAATRGRNERKRRDEGGRTRLPGHKRSGAALPNVTELVADDSKRVKKK